MSTYILATLRRSILTCLLFTAFAVATLTATALGQNETKSGSSFQGSNPWYPTASHPSKIAVGNNPIYTGSAIAVVMANHDFDAMAVQP